MNVLDETWYQERYNILFAKYIIYITTIRTEMDFNFDHLFTTDPRIIEDQIISSKYKTEIDSTVITKINQHVDDEDFNNYVGGLEDEEYYMYMKYYNSFYKNKKIEKILYKENKYVDDSIEVNNWYKRLHGAYEYQRDKQKHISTT